MAKKYKSFYDQAWHYHLELHYALEREVTKEQVDFPTKYDLREENRTLEKRLLRTPGGEEAVKRCRVAVGMPVNHEFEISFCVSGHVTQTVEITDLKLTAEQLEQGLSNGKYATTIQENGSVDIIKSGKSIGRVVYTDNECDYDAYTVEEQSYVA